MRGNSIKEEVGGDNMTKRNRVLRKEISYKTSAMPRILGERERPHWLWPESHTPCRVFYDSRLNTALNKLFTGGQHRRCIAYD